MVIVPAPQPHERTRGREDIMKIKKSLSPRGCALLAGGYSAAFFSMASLPR